MMTQIDEMNYDRIFEMNKTEFFECLARIAECASLPNELLFPVIFFI